MLQSSISEIRRRISGGELEAGSLVDTALSRINTTLSRNTYLSFNETNVKQQVASAGSITAEPLFLRGIPVSVKDCFDVRGFRTSVGSRFYFETRDEAKQDSGIAQTLRTAGAVIMGKTHLNQLAYGLTGENQDFGNCVQFDRAELLTGGSSSGGAASILEGSAMVAIGTDTGGSIRFPASLCSLFGYRSSVGTGSWRGGYHLAESFDTIGFLFRHLEDAQPLGNAILGIPFGTDRRERPVRIGLVGPEFFFDAEAEIVAGMRQWQQRFGDCEFETLDASAWDESLEIFRPIQASEAAGYHAGHFDHFESPIAGRLRWGASLPDAELKELRERRAIFERDMASLFQRFDFLLLPTAPISRLKNGEDHGSARDQVLRYTTPASVTGIPCLALPNEHGGCQLLGPRGGDADLLAFAATISKA